MKTKIIIIQLLLFLIKADILAYEKQDFQTLELDRPIWALSLKDASWLFPKKELKTTTFAIFSFSVEMNGVPKEGRAEAEDDAGRISRALPLYFGERINIETRSKAINYNTVLKNVGPVVAGKRTCGKDIATALKTKNPSFIITGHLKKDYLNLRNKLTVYVYDCTRKKEIILIDTSILLSDEHQLATQVARSFLKNLYKYNYCSRSPLTSNFPAPPDNLLSPYLNGLGQLFMQTLVQNNVVSKDSLWGEDNMINWYLKLWNDIPQSDATKMMYFRGVMASIDYRTEAYKSHTKRLEDYFTDPKNKSDVLNKLSPIYYQTIKNDTLLRAKCIELKSIKDTRYSIWLNQFDTK